MNYSLITNDVLQARYKSVPLSLREVLDSGDIMKVVSNIARTQYFDEEKTLRLGQLVGLVFLGFISSQELVRELQEQLFLNPEHARVVARELDTRIFDALREEINDVYNPEIEKAASPLEPTIPVAMGEEPRIEGPASVVAKEDEGMQIRVAAPIEEASAPVTLPVVSGSEGPMVLQKGASFFEKREEGAKEKRSFVPFSMFASSAETTEARPTVKVKVETPQTFAWPFEKKKKPEEKVVHYNEAHASSGAFPETPAGLINLDAFQKSAAPAAPASITPAPALVSPVTPEAGRGGPKPDEGGLVPPKSNEGGPTSTPAAPEPEKKDWSVKTIFQKAPAPEKKVVIDSVAAPLTPEPVTIPVSVGSTPAPTEPAPASLPSEGPALEGNVVHLK